MKAKNEKINEQYENHYAERTRLKVYPTEFVVRTFLADYPKLNFAKPTPGQKILDVGFGDWRNTAFLSDLGLTVSGIEITQGIVDQTNARLSKLGHKVDLRVGRNSGIPFEDNSFDYILACHSCYYCDEGETIQDNLREYSRVLKIGGYLIASVARTDSYIFNGATDLSDGSLIVQNDPYNNRNGYRLQAFTTPEEVASCFSVGFGNFSFGSAVNDYYGIDERVFWVTCQKMQSFRI